MTIFPALGYTAQQRRDVVNAVGGSYTAKTRVHLLDLDGSHLGPLTTWLADGEVQGNRAAMSRTGSVTFTDPKRKLPFDADDPAETAVDNRRMLQIVWSIWIPAWTDYADIPIFTGPVWGMQRDGDQAVISIRDKAAFGMSANWSPLHLSKHMKKTDAIRRILTERMGALDHELDIPDLDVRLPKHVSLHRQAKPWLVARRIARSMDRELFYDGAGICRLRHHPQTVRFSFTGQAHVTTPIQVGYDPDQLVNAVYVEGAQPKGPKTQITAEAVAPANHRFSPDKLGRNGTPRYLAKFVSDSTLKTQAEAQARADRVLADGLMQGVDVTFSCVPVPFLNLGDMCHVDTDDGDVTFRLNTFSLPLLVGDGTSDGTQMSVGVRKKLTKPRHDPRHKGHQRDRRRHRRHAA